jgi:hypothetical protein
MMDAIVLTAIVCAAVFVIAWLLRPDLRAWIERPKYRFQANVRSYDQAQRALGQSGAKAESGTRRSP